MKAMRWAALLLWIPVSLPAQPATPEQLFREAVAAQQQGNDTLAISKYQALLKLRSDVPEVHANLGAAYSRLGRFADAIRHYKAALTLAPANPALQWNLALAHYKNGEFGEAIPLLQALIGKEPDNLRTALLLADSYNRVRQQARTISLLTRLEPAHPDDLALQWLLGAALVASGRKRDGLLRLDKAARAGKSAEACLLAGQTALEMQEYEIARDYAELALRLNPALPGVLTLAGMARHYLADDGGARDALNQALAANPDDFQAHLYLGAILLTARDLDAARAHLEHALKQNPEDKLALYQMAKLERTAGNIERAAAHLEHVIRIDAAWPQPHIELSALYFRLNRPGDGERERAVYDKLSGEKHDR